jgi:hypothetical protein
LSSDRAASLPTSWTKDRRSATSWPSALRGADARRPLPWAGAAAAAGVGAARRFLPGAFALGLTFSGVIV